MDHLIKIKKCLALIIAGFYLVFGGAWGHAFVWCSEPGQNTHLEFNLAGSCGLECETRQSEQAVPTSDDVVGEACEDFSSKSIYCEASSSRAIDSIPSAPIASADFWQQQTDLTSPQHKGLFSPKPHSGRSPGIAQLILRTTVLRH